MGEAPAEHNAVCAKNGAKGHGEAMHPNLHRHRDRAYGSAYGGRNSTNNKLTRFNNRQSIPARHYPSALPSPLPAGPYCSSNRVPSLAAGALGPSS